MLLGILTSRNGGENIDAFEGMDVDLYPAPGPLWIDGDTWAGKPLLNNRIDDLGHIVFSDVPEGEFVMVLYLPAFEVIVEGLTIPQGNNTPFARDVLKGYVKIGRWEQHAWLLK